MSLERAKLGAVELEYESRSTGQPVLLRAFAIRINRWLTVSNSLRAREPRGQLDQAHAEAVLIVVPGGDGHQPSTDHLDQR